MELLAGEKCLLVNEAKTVAPRIVDVKRSFTPRTLNDVARRLTVNIFRRETVQFARPLVHSIDVFDGKVNVIGKRLRFQIGNVLAVDVDESQNHRAAIDVMTRSARNSAPAIAEQLAVELFSPIEIVDLENDSVECWGHREIKS